MASSAVTLSVVATPESSLVAAPADIAAHWGIELGASVELLAPSQALVVRSDAYVIRDAKTSLESVMWEHDQRIADETVAAYVDAGGRDESHALEPLLRQVLLAVALHARTRKATGQSWSPEFQGMLETALERFV